MTELEIARKIIDQTDRELARLFEKRMEAVKSVAEYKKQNGLPVFDAEREKAVIERNAGLVKEEYREYFEEFLRFNMELSKKFQKTIL